MQLYLVRHGETEWSLSGQHTGRTDIPLTAHGEEQARHLTATLGKVQFAHVLSSPRLRARRTCALSGAGDDPAIEQDAVEWDYGDYEGVRSDAIHKDRPDWNLFRDGCPNGESPSQIAERADRLAARLRGLEGNVALFSHGHFSVVLAARWIGLPVPAAEHFLFAPAALGILGMHPTHRGVPVIALWNLLPE